MVQHNIGMRPAKWKNGNRIEIITGKVTSAQNTSVLVLVSTQIAENCRRSILGGIQEKLSNMPMT